MFRFWWCVPFFTAQVFDNDGIVVKATGLAVWEVELQQPTHGRLDRQLLGSWVTWCFLRLAFLQVTCFFLWLAFFDQVILVFFFIACFVRGPVSSMVHPHKLSFHSRPCLQGFWFGMSFHPSFRCPVSHTHGHSIAAKVRGTGVPAHSPPP